MGNMKSASQISLALLVLTLAGCDDSTDPSDGDGNGDGEPPPGVELAVEVVASGLDDPTYLTAPPNDARLFVVEKSGRVRIIKEGSTLAAPFIDLSDSVSNGSEQGLLSMAFHPSYGANGLFYVSYSDRNGDTRVERYTVSADPDRADAGSGQHVFSHFQPFSNHNGGLILFGPDGKFYIGLGDGGSANDPQGNGQNTATLLGTILRVDVDAGDPFAIPPDNPFVGVPGAQDTIWVYGLRNPWRFAFDFEDGHLYIADVGQGQWEEVSVVASDVGGFNFGWNILEGAHCFLAQNCQISGLELPVIEYSHGEGCSVTGGFVYRGAAIPEIDGHYFYSDYCAGFLRSFRFANDGAVDRTEWAVGNLGRVLSFGQDSAGELYILSEDGTVYRIVS